MVHIVQGVSRREANTAYAEQQLWDAARQGDSGKIRLLVLDRGVDVDARDDDGFTAFNLATASGHTDTAKTILALRQFRFLQKLGADTPAAAQERAGTRAAA